MSKNLILMSGVISGLLLFSNNAYANENPPVYQQKGGEVHYNWGLGSPPGMPVDNFTAIFDQTQYFQAGDYFIQARADDGVKVEVDGKWLIDRWTTSSGKEDRALWLGVNGGTHTVKTHYLEKVNEAGVFSDIVPFGSWLAYYYTNKDLKGLPSKAKVIEPTGKYNKLVEDNGYGSPIAGIPRDHFSVKYTTAQRIDAGEYILRTRADDGVRVYIDGKLVMDRWNVGEYSKGDGQKVTIADRTNVSANEKNVHWIEIQYREDTSSSYVEFFLEPFKTSNSWMGELFPNKTLEGSPVIIGGENAWTKLPENLDLDWGHGRPHSVIPTDHFSGRFTKTEDFEGGPYLFETTSDDGVRVWVDDKKVIDAWSNGTKRKSGVINLSPGKHTIKVEYYEHTGPSKLKVDYKRFSNINFGKVGNVHYNWGSGSPTGMPNDYFTAVFDQSKTFQAGDYFIQARADDGVRVEVDGKWLIDRWTTSSGKEDRALWLGVTSGNHMVKTHYYEEINDAGVFSDIVPFGSWLAYYYTNKELKGLPANAKVIAPTGKNNKLVEDNGNGSPMSGIPKDHFSAKYTTAQRIEAGEYILRTRADDGVRVYIDGKLVMDRWNVGEYSKGDGQKVTISDRPNVSANEKNVHWIEIHYREDTSSSYIEFFLEPFKTSNSWMGELFPNKTLEGSPVIIGGENAWTKLPNTLDLDWGYGRPHSTIPTDHFSGRFTKTEDFEGGLYLFETTSDDGVRVWVDDKKIIDAWSNGTKRQSGVVNLNQGKHTIKVEYFEHTGPAKLKVDYKRFTNINFGKVDKVHYNWGNGGPAGGPSDYFTAVFDQSKSFQAGDYFIQARADDGVKVEVDGKWLIDRWTTSSGKEDRALWLGVTSGNHTVKTHYYEEINDAGVFSDIVPFGSWLAYYYPNQNLKGLPVNAKVIAPTGELNKLVEDNGMGSPAVGIPNDRFSAKYTTAQRIKPGEYIMRTRVDDGVRVYIDGKLVLDRWNAGEYSKGDGQKIIINDHVNAPANEKDIHWIEVQYREDTSASYVEFFLEPFTISNEWIGEIFTNSNFEGNPVVLGGKNAWTKLPETLNFNWGSGSPHSAVPADNFSGRFTKSVQLEKGTYVFEAKADDRVKVYLNDKLVLDSTSGTFGKTHKESVYVDQPGEHKIIVEYVEHSGVAYLSFNHKKISDSKIFYQYNGPINYNWELGSPSPDMPTDNFEALFENIEYFNGGDYFVQSFSDDGVRVTIDGKTLIDRWTSYSTKVDRALWLGATKGEHTVTTQYLEQLNQAGIFSDVVPFGSWIAYYYKNQEFKGLPAASKVIAPTGAYNQLIENNGHGSPASGIPNDHFVAMYTSADRYKAGRYVLRTKADDGIRVYLDGELILDRWSGGYDEDSLILDINDRTNVNQNEKDIHWIVVEYKEDTYASYLEFSLQPLVKYDHVYSYTDYNLTLSDMVSKQMAASTPPQTDKNYDVYIREDALKIDPNKPNVGDVVGGPWNLREKPSATENSRILGKVSQKDGNGKQVTLTLLSSVKGEDGFTWYKVLWTWKNASRADTQYYIDPNNFTDKKAASYLQFLLLSESAGLNATEVNTKILKGKGILENQAEAFIKAGDTYKINEIYLMAHALHETGNGKSELGRGVLVKEVDGKPVEPKVVYNMYGIKAFDHCALKCGSEYAYQQGWFTPEAAIIGGAKFIAEDYISIGQDTLYKMKWNPEKPATHQYATDIGWAVKQTGRIASLYDLLDSYRLIFDIPKYK